VGFKGLHETFTSRVNKHRPDRICVDYVDGPLKYLRNEWAFKSDGQGGSLVDFSVDFAFRSALFEALAGQMFERAFRKMTGAFEERARALYGETGSGMSSSSAQSAA
jgi:coenzyme Q-binding protein COQ10